MSSSPIRILEASPENSGATPAARPASDASPFTANVPVTLLDRMLYFAIGVGRRLSAGARAQRKAKAMRLCESISLGEKRFLAIVEVGEERILIGGSASTVTMLTRLPEQEHFSTILLQRTGPVQTA